jgi:hypothetical protein
MHNLFKKIFVFLIVAAAFPAAVLAATVNLQLQIPSAGGTSGGSGASGGTSGSTTNTPVVNQSRTVSGWTSPNAFVEAISGNQIVGTAIATTNGSFTLNSIFDSVLTLTIRSTDVFGALAILNMPVNINTAPLNVTGVVLPPSLSLPGASFPVGGRITGSGRTIPGAVVSAVLIASNGNTLTQFPTVGTDGSYGISFDGALLPTGPITLQISVNFNGKNETTTLKSVIGKAIVPVPAGCAGVADLNCDGRVNLQDVSILLAYFNKKTFPAAYDLNHDSKINLIDFSIVLYYLNKPVRTAVVAAMVENMPNENPLPPMLDVGKDLNGDWVAAFAIPDAMSGIVGTDISVDNGVNWRPAESPYRLGKTEPANVAIRAKFADGTTSQTAFKTTATRPLAAVIALGAAFAVCLIIIFEFTLRRRRH